MKCNMCGKKATTKDLDPYFEELPELLPEGEENEEELSPVIKVSAKGLIALRNGEELPRVIVRQLTLPVDDNYLCRF